MVTKQCTLKFAITSDFIDEVTYDGVPLDVCQVTFGGPYLWARDAVLYRKPQKYRLLKGGIEFVIVASKAPLPETSLTGTQAKRKVNTCRNFVMLMIQPHGEVPSSYVLSSVLLYF